MYLYIALIIVLEVYHRNIMVVVPQFILQYISQVPKAHLVYIQSI
jgi:hypothetical protein